jgi:hypothetical protein
MFLEEEIAFAIILSRVYSLENGFGLVVGFIGLLHKL